MPGLRASCSHLNSIVMPQRCSVLHGIRIGDQDGCQARVFCIPTRPTKSEPKSATFGGCDSRNNLMPGLRASCSHLNSIVMPQRCSVLHGIRIGDQDGCQARVFCIPTRPTKSEPKSATFGGCDSRNNLMPGLRASCSYFPLNVMPQKFWNRGPRWLSSQCVLHSDETNAWPEGILLPLDIDCYATKVFSPPWYCNQGPG